MTHKKRITRKERAIILGLVFTSVLIGVLYTFQNIVSILVQQYFTAYSELVVNIAFFIVLFIIAVVMVQEYNISST